MKAGIIGVSRSGKTTLFSLLANFNYETAASSQLSGKIRSGLMSVPEPRLDSLAKEFGTDKNLISPQIELVDTEPLSLPASAHSNPTERHGRAGNSEILSLLQETEIIFTVIPAYETPDKSPESLTVQIENIKVELILTDLKIIEKRMEKLNQQLTKPTPSHEADRKELEILGPIRDRLSNGQPVTSLKLSAETMKLLRGFGFLSHKPLVIIVNVSELDLNDDRIKEMEKYYPHLITASLKLELELNNLPDEERTPFMKDYGLVNLSRDRIIRSGYTAAGYISFFTIGKKEIRAWPVKKDDNIITAAGKVHTDMARGFISAEVVTFEEWQKSGSFKNARQQGKVRLEGKTYLVKDGDIIQFKFNV